MKYPLWITFKYTMFYRSSKEIGYTKSITSERDFINFINRIDLEQKMIKEFKVNGQTFPIARLTNIFLKAAEFKTEEAI